MQWISGLTDIFDSANFIGLKSTNVSFSNGKTGFVSGDTYQVE
jgi:hypothetical protein